MEKKDLENLLEFAKLKLNKNEYDKYLDYLNKELDELDEIGDLDINGEELIFVNPNEVSFREDEAEKAASIDDIMLNAKKKKGSFIEVPVMLNEE